MIYASIALSTLLMIVLALGVATIIARRRRADWGLFGVGAATFVLSQVFHIPFNILLTSLGVLPAGVPPPERLLFVSVVLGLSAGLFEEPARYLSYRYWIRRARTTDEALMFGAGHGGIEAILVGFIGLINALFLAAFDSGRLLSTIPAEQLPLLEQQLEAINATALYVPLLGVVERLFAILFHLAAALLVLQCFRRGGLRWLFLAILYHTVLNAGAFYALNRWGALAAEGVLLVLVLPAVWVVYRLGRPEPGEPELSLAETEEEPTAPRPVPLTREKLDDSRYV